MTTKQAYREVYSLYRDKNASGNEAYRTATQQLIDRMHRQYPVAAANAHTSYSLRGLFNS